MVKTLQALFCLPEEENLPLPLFENGHSFVNFECYICQLGNFSVD